MIWLCSRSLRFGRSRFAAVLFSQSSQKLEGICFEKFLDVTGIFESDFELGRPQKGIERLQSQINVMVVLNAQLVKAIDTGNAITG